MATDGGNMVKKWLKEILTRGNEFFSCREDGTRLICLLGNNFISVKWNKMMDYIDHVCQKFFFFLSSVQKPYPSRNPYFSLWWNDLSENLAAKMLKVLNEHVKWPFMLGHLNAYCKVISKYEARTCSIAYPFVIPLPIDSQKRLISSGSIMNPSIK